LCILTHATELKETHLAPLANTFSRSSSTSTIVDQQTPKAATSPGSSNATLADPSGIGAFLYGLR
jgi:serum/glucocorticoid-regulated kinase 2